MPETKAPLLSGYQVVAEIGSGGMGTVYFAKDKAGRPVAVKVMHAEHVRDPTMLRRIRTGYRSAARLDHPNIVAIRALELEHDPPFVVMELVLTDEGTFQNLRHLSPCNDKEILHATVVSVMKQLCDAVAFAHEQGVIHRDIKPGNVLLGPGKTVKLCDFELASVALGSPADAENSLIQSMEMTRSGQVLGTYEYMSPEQRLGRPATAQSDVYSLTAIAYFLLTGQPPVGYPSPIDLGDDALSTAWTSLLRRGMANELVQRFSSAEELRNALCEISDGALVPSLCDGVLPPPDEEPPESEAPAYSPAVEGDDEEAERICRAAAEFLCETAQEDDLKRLEGLLRYRNEPIDPTEYPWLVEAINNWSNDKFAYIKNLGYRVRILRATRDDAVIARLGVTVYHNRLMPRKIRYPQGSLRSEQEVSALFADACTSRMSPIPSRGFEEGHFEDEDIEGAIMIVECEPCNGCGTLACADCRGRGEMLRSTCPSCDGTGDDATPMGCSDCGGTGEVNQIIECPGCGGSGEHACPCCDGQGKISVQFYQRYCFRRHEFDLVSTTSGLPRKVILGLPEDETLDHRILEGRSDLGTLEPGEKDSAILANAWSPGWPERLRRKWGGETEDVPEIVDWELEIMKTIKSWSTSRDDGSFPVSIEIIVNRMVINTIAYQFAGREYVLWVAGNGRVVYAKSGPSRLRCVAHAIRSRR